MKTPLPNDFAVISLPLGPIDTNCHILFCRPNESQSAKPAKPAKAIVIDAPLGAAEAVPQVLQQQNLKAQALLLTHGHWDHIAQAEPLRQSLGVEIWGSRQDALLFENPQIMRSFIEQLPGYQDIPPLAIDHYLQLAFPAGPAGPSKQSITIPTWPELEVQALAMPGHTPGGLAYSFAQAGCAMSGDQLFYRSVGRSDFPGGDPCLLAASIRAGLYALRPDCILFAGHGERSRIGDEMQHNPFVPAC